MDKNKHSSVLLVALTNLLIICLAQYFYALMLIDNNVVTIFQLFYIPLISITINLLLWSSRFKIKFYLHWIFVYISYFFSIFIFYFINYINVDSIKWGDFPPGEAYWDLFLYVFVNSMLQLSILFFLNIATCLLYKIIRRSDYTTI